jgi:hypothetical protein
MSTCNILILGASYGSLLASKILLGGHSVKLVCLPVEADLINSEGFRVRIPIRGRREPIELDSRKLPGRVSAAGATDVDPREYDLISLAMQEPQYGSPGVRELMNAVATSRGRAEAETWSLRQSAVPFERRQQERDHGDEARN